MAGHFTYAWTGADQVAKAGRTFRLGRSCLSRVSHGTGSHRYPGRFRAIDRDRQVRGTGAEEIARAAAADIAMISLDDPCYPPRLKEIYDPPLILDVRGNPEVLTRPGIAMVGTRHPTPYGSGMAERLASRSRWRKDWCIISGMARG